MDWNKKIRRFAATLAGNPLPDSKRICEALNTEGVPVVTNREAMIAVHPKLVTNNVDWEEK